MSCVQRHGVRIAFEVVGRGPAVVLLHSFLCSGAMWQNQVGPLAARFRVVNVDFRGHGASGGVSEAFDLYDLMEDVLAVLDRVGIDRAAWAGLSIGGMVALRGALRAPDRVNALVLVDTDAGAERFANRLKHAALASVARVAGVRPVIPQIARLMFGRTTRRRRPELVAQWTELFAHADVPSALWTLRALDRRDDLSARLPEIDMPALVLVGAEDRALPPGLSRWLARALPRARLVEIPAAGHLSSLEQPGAVTAAMLEFLGSAEVVARSRAGVQWE